MAVAYQHRPLSKILVPQAGATGESQTPKDEGADDAGKDTKLPEKYQGKTLEDIIAMHQNAERRLGELGNELGTYRGLVSDLSKIQRQPVATKTDETGDEVDVSGDEFIADPVKAIRKVVKHDMSRAELDRREADLANQIQAATNQLVNDYGDIGAIVKSEEFQEFAGRTNSRREDFQTAAYGGGMEQVRAARRLLEDYSDYKELVGKQKERSQEHEEDVNGARKASTEGGGNAGTVASKKQYRESELLEVIQKEPEKWRSPAYQAEIMKAIKEGRYIKNA